MNHSAFERFVADRRRDLQRISRSTRSEHSLADVVNEAWIEAMNLEGKGHCIEFLSPPFQQLLISHLYQRLVRYTDLKVRHGMRLDHAAPGDDGEASHWLLRTLVSDGGEHPLTLLERLEESSSAEPCPGSSQAGAYAVLLDRFHNSMRAVSNYLLISRSYAYRRCAHAKMIVECQRGILSSGTTASHADFPRPWRKSRYLRIPLQLSLPLDDELPFDSK